MKIDSENYVIIHGWMRTELNLKNNSLLVYAIIYAFTQTDEGRFKGGLQYIADWCGATKNGIRNCVKVLIAKGLIDKEEKNCNGVNFVDYWSTPLTRVVNNVSQAANFVDPGGQNSSPQNKEKNNREKNNRFFAPSVEDVAAYCRGHGYTIDAQYFVDFYASKGWMVGRSKMKDWEAAVRNWARNAKKTSNCDVGATGVKLLPEDQRSHDLDDIFKGA